MGDIINSEYRNAGTLTVVPKTPVGSLTVVPKKPTGLLQVVKPNVGTLQVVTEQQVLPVEKVTKKYTITTAPVYQMDGANIIKSGTVLKKGATVFVIGDSFMVGSEKAYEIRLKGYPDAFIYANTVDATTTPAGKKIGSNKISEITDANTDNKKKIYIGLGIVAVIVIGVIIYKKFIDK